VGLKRDDEGITAEMVDEIGGRIPFARAMDLEKWSLWVRKEQVEAMTLIYNVDEEKIASDVFGKESTGLILPLIIHHQKSVAPVGHNTILKTDDTITCLIRKEKKVAFNDWLADSPFSI
jgi:hypothetical protein